MISVVEHKKFEKNQSTVPLILIICVYICNQMLPHTLKEGFVLTVLIKVV